MIKKIRYAAYIAIIAIFVITAITLIKRHFREKLNAPEENQVAAVQQISTAGLPSIGGSFQLTDHTGQHRSNLDFRGKYTLVYFGYSYCPDICPTALSGMTEALVKLGAKANKVTPIFISVDPQRDTVANLAEYVANFHPSFVGLTGTEEQVKKAMKAYRVYAAKVDESAREDYLMDHSSIIYVMNPQGQFVAHFNHETPAEDMVAALEPLIG
jgi:protein SCO1/2